ncbi:NAD-dependent epimerase/dehydratase family protein [Deinococcus radiodurans]|uniref:NAD-dependent epimerase/dehydratase family protein n=1 Tax=Deinococcus radiodurans TaxID=1299 RepID=UPI00031A06FD|nr:NAD(P)-dependent oxidoreductase [Deinococcus radiodurans]QIP28862.1 NAD(P)-dependent oxidoreductase [Deinococcus radiodurans]QIP32432.1 NAD(P)-dependent oxidoreductase [Deinococcus radiodurans]UID69709.1 snoG protein [Deinococcus radiodurans R1 = ATCC 13939 = DSM 20539]UTA50276.1 NAD(P)-dependent oxidoreductase [Deinococcus radiodurans]
MTPNSVTPPQPGRVLLLGAGGFLGGVIARELRDAGVDVRTTTGDLTALTPADWAAQLDGASAVINAAGRTAGSLSDLTRANVLLLAGVLEAVQAADLRLIHLASAAEYGRTPEGEASREDGPAQPLSPYGASKLAGTVLLEEAVRTGRADALALRLTNPVGAGMNPGSLPGRAARELRAAAEQGLPSVRFGPLGAFRDFIAARDVGRAVLHFLHGQPGEEARGVLNLGSGVARPVRDLVTELARIAGYGGDLLEDAPGSPRSGDVPYQRADLTALKASGYTPGEDLAAALTELYSGGS